MAYSSLQLLVGAKRARRILVEEYIQLKPHDRVLDIGCGPAELLEFLPSNVEYHGYDLSNEYIAQAKQKYKNRGRFFCADITKLDPLNLEKFDCAIATGLLHHLDDNEVIALLKIVEEILNPGGRLITLDNCYTPNQSKAAKYIISRDRGKNVRTEEGYRSLIEKVFPHIKIDVREDLLRVPYTHIIITCRRSPNI